MPKGRILDILALEPHMNQPRLPGSSLPSVLLEGTLAGLSMENMALEGLGLLPSSLCLAKKRNQPLDSISKAGRQGLVPYLATSAS